MTGLASPEKASNPKKKSERKCATKEEYKQLSSIMGGMNILRKQVCICDKDKLQKERSRVSVCNRRQCMC